MTIWTPDLSRREGPLYLAVADAVAAGIEEGDLRPGDRLPTQRDLADGLGIALTTVTRGYAEAERRGLLRGEVGRGTFVRTRAPRVSSSEEGSPPPGEVDLRPNALLPWPLGPELLDAMARIMTAGDPHTLFGYGPHRGQLHHRTAVAQWLTRSGLASDAEQMLLTVGAQHAMMVVFASLTQPGDELLVEEVAYGGVRSLASLLGLKLRPVAIDAEGMVPDALREACAAGRPKALYCTPSLQNPTSAVMSDARRRDIAAVAAEAGVTVIEDDSYGFVLPDAVPLTNYTEHGFYITGTSKSLLPALRVGFIRAPRAMVSRLEAIISATVYMTSPVVTEIVAEWLTDGTADKVIAWKREQFAVRQGAARRLLAAHDYQAHPRSPHGWLRLPEPWTARDFVQQASLRHVHLSPADDFCVGRSVPHAVRLCVGHTPSRAELEGALSMLDTMLVTGPEAGRVVV